MTFGRLFADTAFLPIYMTRLRFNTKIHLPAGDCAGRDKASAVTRVCGDSTRSTSSVGLRVILSRSFWTATNNNDENMKESAIILICDDALTRLIRFESILIPYRLS